MKIYWQHSKVIEKLDGIVFVFTCSTVNGGKKWCARFFSAVLILWFPALADVRGSPQKGCKGGTLLAGCKLNNRHNLPYCRWASSFLIPLKVVQKQIQRSMGKLTGLSEWNQVSTNASVLFEWFWTNYFLSLFLNFPICTREGGNDAIKLFCYLLTSCYMRPRFLTISFPKPGSQNPLRIVREAENELTGQVYEFCLVSRADSCIEGLVSQGSKNAVNNFWCFFSALWIYRRLWIVTLSIRPLQLALNSLLTAFPKL